jgi:hypothetical protein
MELLGTPPDDLINQATRRRLFFGEYKEVHASFVMSLMLIVITSTPQIREAFRAALRIQKVANASQDQRRCHSH